MSDIQILSGLGVKQAAAILVNVNNKRILLDAGASLDQTKPCSWYHDLQVDAIILSHDHDDHMGSLVYIDKSIPVYCTQDVAKQLPEGSNWHEIPLHGQCEVLGITLTTGRNGHSLGGVWLHLDIGQGLFYSGDFCLESQVFYFDYPPKAATALMDASYGFYDESLVHCQSTISQWLPKPTLFPVPASGRAAEILIWLTQNYSKRCSIDQGCLSLLLPMLEEGKIKSASQDILKHLLTSVNEFNIENPFLLVSSPDVSEGIGKQIANCANRQHQIIFTGYMPNALPVTESPLPEIAYQRWNVHPKYSDLMSVLKHINCQQCVPLFCDEITQVEFQQTNPNLFRLKHQLSII